MEEQGTLLILMEIKAVWPVRSSYLAVQVALPRTACVGLFIAGLLLGRRICHIEVMGRNDKCIVLFFCVPD